MKDEKLKFSIYIVLAILILLFYTKDIDLFNGDKYNEIKLIDNPDSYLVLVNKKYQLEKEYEPDDLEKINIKYANEDKYLRKGAKEAFEKLSSDALKNGYNIIAISAYRPYDYQEKLYNEYISTMGIDYADKCSARAGHSEHQTGLAVDVEGENHNYNEFENSKEFEWMINNAHKYGFILRYPKGKTNITGFKYEPWHYRYVGNEVAQIIYNENITLEEYYNKYINLK